MTLPESFKKSFKTLFDSEWWRLETLPELGGQLVPRTVVWGVAEQVLGSNPALHMYMAGAPFAGILYANGNETQKKMAQQMVDRGWGATMVLTEPDAGSDVGAGRTKAVEQPDGSWHIEGVKRFITSAEQDITENIVHLVLARPEGAGPGTKGLSLFVVPKFHFDPETGELGERNGAYVTNVEHKMGLKASTTCELRFGENPDVPAKGWLVGDVHNGIAQMFQVIEHARMMVGTKAIATLSTGYLNALEFAKTRVQSADLTRSGDKTAPRVTIINHPDVRRSLMMNKAYAEGMRSLVLLHVVRAGPDHRRRARGHRHRARRRDQRPAAADRQGRRVRSARTTSWPRRCRSSAARATCRTTRSSSTSATPRSTPSTRAPRRSRRRTSSSARSSATRVRRSARCRPRSPSSSSRSRTRAGSRRSAAALQKALEDFGGMVGAMFNQLMSGQEDVANVYKVGQNATRLLHVGRRPDGRLPAAAPGLGRADQAGRQRRCRPPTARSTRASRPWRTSSRRPSCPS